MGLPFRWANGAWGWGLGDGIPCLGLLCPPVATGAACAGLASRRAARCAAVATPRRLCCSALLNPQRGGRGRGPSCVCQGQAGAGRQVRKLMERVQRARPCAWLPVWQGPSRAAGRRVRNPLDLWFGPSCTVTGAVVPISGPPPPRAPPPRRVRFIVSGGAPLAPHVEDFCNVCMAPLLQASLWERPPGAAGAAPGRRRPRRAPGLAWPAQGYLVRLAPGERAGHRGRVCNPAPGLPPPPPAGLWPDGDHRRLVRHAAHPQDGLHP